MVADVRGAGGGRACESARQYEILSKCADANTLAIDADRKDLPARGGCGFFYTGSRPELNQQSHTTTATRSANFSAKRTGFPCSRHNAVDLRS